MNSGKINDDSEVMPNPSSKRSVAEIVVPFDDTVLPEGIRARMVPDINGMRVHILESGYEHPERPVILLIHGFPELAYSWRKVMPDLALQGYHVIAYDQRGYGRTSGWKGHFEDDIAPFSLCRMAGDAVVLMAKMGVTTVAMVVGHDFGSPVAACCAMMRPDIFRSVVLMSAPFSGPASLMADDTGSSKYSGSGDIHQDLAELARPRKHYQWYYSGAEANTDMWQCDEGVHQFLRNYYHVKSADWSGNRIFPLPRLSAAELSRMPTYYIMDQALGMAATVAQHAPDEALIDQCGWLPEADLQVYSREYLRTGFQGGLQSYRCNTSGLNAVELAVYSGTKLQVPSLFMAGNRDWGVYQFPGDLQRLENVFSANHRGTVLVPNAGHWVQQEQPQAVLKQLTVFLQDSGQSPES